MHQPRVFTREEVLEEIGKIVVPNFFGKLIFIAFDGKICDIEVRQTKKPKRVVE
jgi:hypothetical protein